MYYRLALALALTACSGSKDDEELPTEETEGEPTGDSAPVYETGLLVQTEEGDIIVAGGTYEGVVSYHYADRGTATNLCSWTWDAVDWETDPLTAGSPDPIEAECADADGNPCEFAYSVNWRNGTQSDGDCTPFITDFAGFANGVNPAGYGWMDDYFYNGTATGPALMYYYANQYGGYWAATDPTGVVATFDITTGEFEYDWLFAVYAYVKP